jgi:hypothetical protein
MASLALSALAAGSASALSVTSPIPGRLPVFSGSSVAEPLIETEGQSPVVCSERAINGKFLNSTSGEAKLTLRGCQYGAFKKPCTSSGQASGTIVSSQLAIQLVYLDAAKTKFGLLISPPANPYFGLFADYTCSGSIPLHHELTGSVIAEITSPALNVSSGSFTPRLFGSGAKQQYQQVEGAGFNYHLTDTVGGGTWEAALNIGSITSAFTNGQFTFVP